MIGEERLRAPLGERIELRDVRGLELAECLGDGALAHVRGRIGDGNRREQRERVGALERSWRLLRSTRSPSPPRRAASSPAALRCGRELVPQTHERDQRTRGDTARRPSSQRGRARRGRSRRRMATLPSVRSSSVSASTETSGWLRCTERQRGAGGYSKSTSIEPARPSASSRSRTSSGSAVSGVLEAPAAIAPHGLERPAQARQRAPGEALDVLLATERSQGLPATRAARPRA